MASSVWTVGQTVSTIDFKKTNAEVAELLGWLIVDLDPPDGLTTAQLNKWKLEQAHKRAMQAVMQQIRQNQLAAASQEEYEAYSQKRQERLAQILAATGLVDEPDQPDPGPSLPPIPPGP